MYAIAFPTVRNSATFWDKGTEVPSLSQDKGTIGQAQNLPWDGMGWDGTVCQKPGRDMGRVNHYFSVKIQEGTQDQTGQSLFFSMISYFRTSFSVLELPFSVLEHPILF